MRKIFFLSLIFVMAASAFADGIKVTGTAPTVGGPGADTFNTSLASAFNDLLRDLNVQFNSISFSSPKKFLQAMGDASVYGSHGATTRGYGGYKIFSATIGTTIGLQLPASISTMINDPDYVQNSLMREGDARIGYSTNILNANVGLNLGIFKFIPEKIGLAKRDNFYIGFRVGYFNLPNIEGFEFKTLTLGLTLNYQILPSFSLAGLIKWRGVSLGSGFIYSNNKTSFTMPIGDPITATSGSATLYMNPVATLNLDAYTFTIPLEAVTAIKLLIFNVPFGLGVDLAFGKTSLGFGVKSDMELRGLTGGLYPTSKGNLSVKYEASNIPSFFNFKIMTGLGFAMGPVVIDIPLTYYPANGYNIGFTIGAVF